ncbi:Hypothetical protein, putative [Bodo saltans]|uniref:PARP catalytic domain-containing protein n=1 Tax=Bodo saltans TaxID=75058 RepID=A0A0S4JM81_BODSA|nr:Hypothetical protein, putative [Bodo saltans]|eukprot:CUG91506.1 Hypothetical protein, putative [Bodo saltans]
MEAFAEELVRFRTEWPVWSLVALDEKKRTVTIERRDEFRMSLLVKVSASYPSGQSTIQNRKTKKIYNFKLQECLNDAIDEALQQWADDSDDDDNVADSPYLCDEGSYSEALFSLSSKSTEPLTGNPEELAAKNSEPISFGDRLFYLWRALASETRPPCRADVFDEPQTSESSIIGLNLSISVRDIDALLSLALGLQHAEYLTVVIDIPFHFPMSSPTVRSVMLCNHPDVRGEIGDVRDSKLGPLSWFIKDRINPLLHQVALAVRNALSSTSAPFLMPRPLDATDAPSITVDWSRAFDESREQWPLLGASFLTYEQITLSDEVKFYDNVRLLASGDNIVRFIAKKFHQLLLSSLENCFVCNDRLHFGGMQLTYCTKELCTFSVERIGLGFDIISEVTKRPEVFELLMLFTYASASNAEKRDTFIPMCTVDISHRHGDILSKYRGPLNFFLSDGKTKNFRLILEVLQQIPSTTSMIKLSGGDNSALRRALDKVHPLVYPFAQWILSSNRSHIQYVPQMYHVRGMGPNQYLIINHNAKKEKAFRLLKAATAKRNGGSGSFFAWHGSATGNWHCILREGLRVYSGTKLMSSGQVYGSGIYLARTISTSIPYMGSSKSGWANTTRFLSPNGCTVLALCEVVDDQRIYTDHNNDIITVSDEDSISTRFLFVFHGSHGPSANAINSLPSNEEIAAQLSAAYSFLL